MNKPSSLLGCSCHWQKINGRPWWIDLPIQFNFCVLVNFGTSF
nr:MAG TPA: hypothetical protein [Caudoviricetes sp.]